MPELSKGGDFINPKDILSLFNIPSEKVKYYEILHEDNSTTFYIELVDIRPSCPYCYSNNVGIKDYYIKRLNNSIIKHECMTFEIRMRRYICKNCKKTFKQQFEVSKSNDSITAQVKQAIIEDLKDRLTFKQIAEDHNVSPTTVLNIFDRNIAYQIKYPLSEVICVDEFCFHHKNKAKYGKFPTVITNPMNGIILDIVESRWKSVLFNYFNNTKYGYRLNVKYFVSDMNETYRQIKKAFFGKALHVADRFHIVKLFNEAITSIRIRIMKQEAYSTNEARYLKKHWKIFLMDRNKLSKYRKVNDEGIVLDQTVELDKCLAKYPELSYAYWQKEIFREKTSEPMLYIEAERIINQMIKDYEISVIEEMNKIGRTFQNWKTEIINGLIKNDYTFKVSNGIAESMNNQIQTLINVSNGLTNFERMRKRVLYINRNKKELKN